MLLPGGRQRDEWQITTRCEIGIAKLARQARAHVLGDVERVLGVADRFGDAFQIRHADRIGAASVCKWWNSARRSAWERTTLLSGSKVSLVSLVWL